MPLDAPSGAGSRPPLTRDPQEGLAAPSRGVGGTETELVARGGIVNVLGNLAGFVDPLLLLLVSHTLGTKTLGSYVLASTYLAVVSRIALLGLDKGLLRYVPVAGQAPHPSAALASVLGTALRFAAGASVLGGVVVTVAADLVVGAGGENADGRASWWLSWMMLALPAQVLTAVLLTAVRGTSRMAPYVLVQNLGVPGLLLVLSGAGIALGGGELVLAYGFVLSSYLGLAVSALVFSRRFASLSWREIGRGAHRRDLLAFSAPQGLTDMMNLLLGRVDIIMIAAFFPDRPELVAVYAIGSMLAGTIKKVRLAFDTSLSPVLAGLLERRSLPEAIRVYRQTGIWIWLFFALAAGVLSLGAPVALRLAGAAFVEAWPVVPILVLGRLVNAVGGPAQTALLMSGRSRLELANNALINVANVGLNWLLIPAWGIYGSAIATSASLTLFNVIRVVQVRRLVGLAPDWRRAARITLAALLALLPALLTAQALDDLLLASGVSAACFAVTYGPALWLAGAGAELSMVMAVFRRNRLGMRGALHAAPEATP